MCSKALLLTFSLILQVIIVSGQRQWIPPTTTAAEMRNPYTWYWPYAIAAAEGYRDYYVNAQQITNQLYMQAYATNAFWWTGGRPWGGPGGTTNPGGGTGGTTNPGGGTGGTTNPGGGTGGTTNPTGGTGGTTNPTGGTGGTTNPTGGTGGTTNPTGGTGGTTNPTGGPNPQTSRQPVANMAQGGSGWI